MGRQCKICWSLHRAEYEDLRLNPKKHLTYQQIIDYAWKKYEEKIGKMSLSRHFNRHVEPVVKAIRESSRFREDLIKKEIHRDIKIAQSLTENLRLLNDQIETVKEQEQESIEDRKETRDIIKSLNETIQLILKFYDKLNLEEGITEEEMYDRLIYSIDFLPNNTIIIIKERWDEYSNVKKEE